MNAEERRRYHGVFDCLQDLTSASGSIDCAAHRNDHAASTRARISATRNKERETLLSRVGHSREIKLVRTVV